MFGLTAHQLEWLLGTVYGLAGPGVWAVLIFGLIKGRKRMNLLLRPTPPLPAEVGQPRVTIIIPAKDEGERIADCLLSAIGQDYPNFGVIAVNDRSTDQTGRVMDELAAAHVGRLETLHVRDGELPAGWTGKPTRSTARSSISTRGRPPPPAASHSSSSSTAM